MVFGYGHLTWEWKKRIRGYFHPLLFAPAYSMLKVLHLDSPAAVIAAPKVVQVPLSRRIHTACPAFLLLSSNSVTVSFASFFI